MAAVAAMVAVAADVAGKIVVADPQTWFMGRARIGVRPALHRPSAVSACESEWPSSEGHFFCPEGLFGTRHTATFSKE